jgi:protocatechuate 3,4-dioxygenase beta subunit
MRYPDSVVVATGQITANINFALVPFAPPPPPNPGSISGIVTDSTTGLPLAGANVMARDRRNVRVATTGNDGSYTITNLRAGAYRVMATKQGYQPKMYPDPVVVASGQAVTGINFALVAGQVPPPPPPGSNGAIAGVVTDSATGLPIRGATVMAHGAASNINGGMAMTDSTGAYTILHLRAGNYMVDASAHNYRPAHYPDPVTVDSAQTTTGINFVLAPFGPPPPPPGTGSISGVVTDSATGLPIRGAMVMVHGSNSMNGGMAMTDSTGAYTIPHLMAGNYLVSASAHDYLPRNYPDPVVVTVNQNTPDINFALPARQH